MDTRELVMRIADEQRMSKAKARRVLDFIIDEIENTVTCGDSIRISKFGTFSVRQVADHKCYNPHTKKIEMLPARRVTHFTPAKAFKDKINA